MWIHEARTWSHARRVRVRHISDTDTCPTRARHGSCRVQLKPPGFGLRHRPDTGQVQLEQGQARAGVSERRRGREKSDNPTD